MKGSSENAVVDALAVIFAEIETHVCTSCWISRVSSCSDLADAPSRGNCQILLKLGFLDAFESASSCLETMLRYMIEKLGKKAAASNPICENNCT